MIAQHKKISLQNMWMVMNPDINEFKQQFALINYNYASHEDDVPDAIIEGLFHIIKMKLDEIQSTYGVNQKDIVCTASTKVNKVFIECLSNCIQHPIEFVENISFGELIVEELKSAEPIKESELIFSTANKRKKTIEKKHIYITPSQDPISSFARYQSWVSFYNKIFEN